MAGNLVPRTDGGSNLGTALKEYGKIFVKELAGTAATLYAKLASPAFTGTPTAPTAASGTSTTQLATTKFVVDEIASELEDKVRLKDTSKRDTAYSTGATVTMPGIPVAMFLECTTAGTTASTAPVITLPISEGNTITDGTVTWTVRRAVCENDYSKTSFGQSVLNHLLGSTLASLVDAVSTDSLFSKLLKKALEAAGLQYSIGANGYICFGALFGGLILQWGLDTTGASKTIYMPISYNTAYSFCANLITNTDTSYINFRCWRRDLEKFAINCPTANLGFAWIAIGF